MNDKTNCDGVGENDVDGIIGAGSVGCGIAACMARTNDLPYYFLTHTARQARVLNKQGINVCGKLGNFNVVSEQCFAVSNFDKFPSCTLVLIAVKAITLEEILKTMRQYREKFANACIVLLQNGIGVADIAVKYFPPAQLFQMRVATGFSLVDDASVYVTTVGEPLLIGSAFGGVIERRYEQTLLRFCQRLKSGGLPAFLSPDVRGAVLAKALFNLCVNAPSAICNSNIGGLDRELVRGIAREAHWILNLKTEGLLAKTVGAFEQYWCRLTDELIPLTSRHFPSMYQDVKAKRRTEIGFLNGKIVQYAKEFDINVPYNAYTCQRILEYEQSLLTRRVLLKNAAFSPMF